VLITHELTERRRELLREGRLDAVIDQNPELAVNRAVELLARHFGRIDEAVSPTTPFTLYLRENCEMP
jgi:LacI family transcriptional regulator